MEIHIGNVIESGRFTQIAMILPRWEIIMPFKQWSSVPLSPHLPHGAQDSLTKQPTNTRSPKVILSPGLGKMTRDVTGPISYLYENWEVTFDVAKEALEPEPTTVRSSERSWLSDGSKGNSWTGLKGDDSCRELFLALL